MAVIKRHSSKATPNKIVNYLIDKEKTEEGLISGKDCNPENVVNEFNATQELYGKNDGVRYHHIVQSFSPEDNINPQKAHELGKELAEKQFKGHEIFIVTHKNKDHIHNHLVVNSVSHEDGKKYRASNKSLWDIKRESNRQCERENLKTIDLNKKAKERITSGELRMTLRGEIPWKEELKQCINLAKEKTRNLKEFSKYLKDNFEVETRITNKTISYRHPDKAKGIRGSRLGTDFDKEGLENEFARKEKGIIRAGSRATEQRDIGGDKDHIKKLFLDGGISKVDSSRASNIGEQGKSELGKAKGERQRENPVNQKSERDVQGDEAGIKRTKSNKYGENERNFSGHAGGNSQDREQSQGNDQSNQGHGISDKTDTQPLLEGKGETIWNTTPDNNRFDSGIDGGLSASDAFDGILQSLNSAINKANATEKANAKQKQKTFKRKLKQKTQLRSRGKSKGWDMER